MTNSHDERTSIDDRVPSQVTLSAIALSFSLPAGKNLSSTVTRELRTEAESRVRVRVSREQLELTLDPAILIDAQWPAMNMELGGVTLDFETGEINVQVGNVHGLTEGFIDFSDNARREITTLVSAGIADTAMANPGYNPMKDPQLLSTLEALADNFRKQPSSGESDTSTQDLGDPRVEVTMSTTEVFEQTEDGAGLSVPKDAVIDLVITGRGNLATITSSDGTAEIIRAAKLESLALSSDAIAVTVQDKPVAFLDRIRIDRGGSVTLERMRLGSSVDEAASLESFLRVVGHALSLTSQGVDLPDGVAMTSNSREAEAQIVPGLVQNKIEAILTESVRQLVRTHRWAIPEVDLLEIFGV